MQGLFPHGRVFLGAHARRRVNKRILWELYWKVNEAKAWVYLVHAEISTSQHEKEFARYMADTWKDSPDPLSWRTDHLVYL